MKGKQTRSNLRQFPSKHANMGTMHMGYNWASPYEPHIGPIWGVTGQPHVGMRIWSPPSPHMQNYLEEKYTIYLYYCQSWIPQTKLYKWSKFEGLYSFTSLHNNCLRFNLVWLPFMTHIRTWPRHCQVKHSDQVLYKKSGQKCGL